MSDSSDTIEVTTPVSGQMNEGIKIENLEVGEKPLLNFDARLTDGSPVNISINTGRQDRENSPYMKHRESSNRFNQEVRRMIDPEETINSNLQVNMENPPRPGEVLHFNYNGAEYFYKVREEAKSYEPTFRDSLGLEPIFLQPVPKNEIPQLSKEEIVDFNTQLVEAPPIVQKNMEMLAARKVLNIFPAKK